MQKSKYNISIRTQYGTACDTMPGYIFYYSGNRYGITNHYRKNGGELSKASEWTISELTTGYSVGIHGTTRQQAINALLNRHGLTAAVNKGVSTYRAEGGVDMNPDLMPDNEFLTVHPCGISA